MGKRRRKLKIGRLLILVTVFVLLLGSIAAIGVYGYLRLRIDSVKVSNVIILGLDKATGGNSRNDAVILLTVDPQKHKVDMLSLPRDSYLRISCLDGKKDKLTHAYVFGGRACAMESVQNLFELEKLDYYITINFKQMVAAIDLIGGVDLVPTKTFCQKGTDKKNYCFTKGESIHLDGQMALAYSRVRKIDSDVERGLRQQEILLAIVEKAKTLSLWELYPLAKEELGMIETNLGMLQLAAFYRMMKAEDFGINKTKIKGYHAEYYSPGTQQNQYMFDIDDKWLAEYRNKLKELLKEAK